MIRPMQQWFRAQRQATAAATATATAITTATAMARRSKRQMDTVAGGGTGQRQPVARLPRADGRFRLSVASWIDYATCSRAYGLLQVRKEATARTVREVRDEPSDLQCLSRNRSSSSSEIVETVRRQGSEVREGQGTNVSRKRVANSPKPPCVMRR